MIEMSSKTTEFRIVIRPGRHDFLGLREYVKEFMHQLYSATNCGVVADFGSEKFAVGPRTLLPLIIPNLGPFKAGTVFSFNQNSENYLYETCILTVVVEQRHRELVASMLGDLRGRMLESGSRVEENPLTV